jgi:hypothetical protein
MSQQKSGLLPFVILAATHSTFSTDVSSMAKSTGQKSPSFPEIFFSSMVATPMLCLCFDSRQAGVGIVAGIVGVDVYEV